MTDEGSRGSSGGSTRHFEHLFRRQAGQIKASLIRILGWDNIELIEDVVQDTFLQALNQWPVRGMPANPAAWLLVTARNRAIDIIRRRASFSEKSDELKHWLAAESDQDELSASFARELADDQLRMIFACCHPSLSSEAQVALTLKILGGLSVDEIARAFFAKPATIAQRVVRAQRRLREERSSLDVPAPDELASRLDTVHGIIYLLFNEGYSAYRGENLIRHELIDEAIRLAELLGDHPVSETPTTHALLALLLLQASRLPARVDGDGNLVLLQDQDRTRWDKSLVNRGLSHLERAGTGEVLSAYHLEAGIAAEHAVARSYEQTNWRRIKDYYDELVRQNHSAVVALNRAVAVAECDGIRAGLAALEALVEIPAMKRYYLYYATRGELHRRLGKNTEACRSFQRALELATTEPERRFLRRRVEGLNT